MSSIFGRVHLDKRPVVRRDTEVMKAALHHWNADDQGVWAKDAAALGHLMLYNTPESLNEKLPLHDGRIDCVITADARIDNRAEIYALLGLRTTEEKQAPDSSLILALYNKYGSQCVQHVVGDFAFAIWDAQRQQLFCARDHMAVKPFFYYCDRNLFAFATEKKGLLAIAEADKSIDTEYLYRHMVYPPEQPDTETLYRHIKRLPAAHTLVLDSHTGRMKTDRYWQLDVTTEIIYKHKEEYYEGLKHYFDMAVAGRTRSAYPVAAELSGGLDSTAITGAACKALRAENKSLITASNTLAAHITDEKELAQSERKYIEAVIAYHKIEDYVLITEDIWDDPIAEIDFSLQVNDGLEMRSFLWQVPLKHAAREKGIRTLLSGFPGDEMVTYKGGHRAMEYLDKKQYWQYLTNNPAKNLTDKLLPLLPPGLAYGFHRFHNFLWLNRKRTRDIYKLLHVPFKYMVAREDALWKKEAHRNRFRSYRHLLSNRLLKPHVYMRMEMETRFGIYFGMETRFPMADIRLTQFYLSMPNYLKHEGPIERTTYRKAVDEYLPPMVKDRIKTTGNLAPFKTNAAAIGRRKEAMAAVYKSIRQNKKLEPYVHQRLSLAEASKYPLHLETLRWLEKNFAMLP